MKNSLIKILSIFLISLFCFSPLGAVDLGQGDDSTQINDNITDFKDLNDTVIADDAADNDDSDMEIKSDNETDDIKAKDTPVEIQSVSVNDSNSTKNLQLHDLDLSMDIEDSFYGEGAIIKINFNNDEFAYVYDQVVKIQGDNFSESVNAGTFKRGCNIVKLRDDMPPGNYNITYTFDYGTYWRPTTVTGQLTVHKHDADIECSVEDVDYGEKPVIKTKCAQQLEGEYIIITSPQFSKVYKCNASQANNEVCIDENLATGNYTCDVFYPSDRTHNTQLTTLNFNVNKLNPNLTVKAEDTIMQGDNLSVEIHANDTINGDVTCNLNGDTQTVHLVNGVGYATIDCHNLSFGYCQLSTSFEGDDIFKKDTVLTDFKVMADPNLRIHVDDSSRRVDKLHVVVDADENFNGNATLTLNNRVWTTKVEVVNGHGECYYPGGDYPGNYTANAKTAENEFFIAGNCSSTYEVKNL